MKVRAPGVRKLRKMIERNDPLSTVTCSQHDTQSGMITKLGLLKSGKLTIRCVSDRGNPLSPFGERHTSPNQVSFHEKTQHVIVDEEEPHDRTGQPVVIPQREMRPQQFIIGNDETELELTVESKSFVNRVNDQVRKRQKTILNECDRRRRKTFYYMVNVHVCDIGISSIHGKEIPEQ